MSQLQVTGEAKIRDIQGPVVANSGVITALDGAASQYVRGDGTLADFPTSSGGGSSVSYYLNSSVSQGTIGGVAYRELSKDPIIGTGTDIAISSNGYVANYITDVNDPDVTIVPGGNFNCEFYFSVDSNSNNPFTYAELYKYDGTTFTLLGSSVGVPEYINQGTIIAPYYFAIPVPTSALALTDRLAIRIYVNVDGRTVTLHTENSHLCQVVTTLSKGMVSLNNLTDQSQFLTTGTAGTNFAIASSGDTHTFNLPVASATNTGKLSSTDWSTFNNKQAALSFTAPLDNTSNTISIPVATSLVDGYLDNLDWVKFNTAYNDSIISAAVTGTTTKTLTLNQQDGGTITASWTDDNTDAVTSVFGRTGAVVAQSGDYTTTQVTEGTNLYFTDTRARAAISLTTTGTSGASTYNNTTGVLNIPQYQGMLTNPVTGTGTTNTLPKFTGASTIGDSAITDNGTNVTLVSRGLIGTTANFSGKVGINATIASWMSAYSAMQLGSLTAIWNSDTNFSGYANNLYYDGTQYRYLTSTLANKFELGLGYFTWSGSPTGTAGNVATINEFMRLDASGNLGMNTLAAIGSRLQVNGNVAIGFTTSTAAPTNGLAVFGASTFSSALSGTSATFASTAFTNLTLNGTNGNGWGNNLAFQSGGTDFGYIGSIGSLLGNTTKDMTIYATSGNGFRVYTNGNNKQLEITTSGVATFSSTIIATGFEVGNGQFYRARRSSGNLLTDMIGIPSATDNVRILTTGAFSVVSGGLVTFLNVSDTGIITLSNLAGTGSRAVLASSTGVLSAPVSDKSVKENITSIGYGLNEIVKMNPVWFNFIDDYKDYGEGRQNGNIAQEMEAIIPEAVFVTPSTGKMGINYDQLHAVYIKAIQELKAEIDQLKALINNK